MVEDAFERTGAALADHVVFPSTYMRDYHREWPLHKVHVVPNLLPAGALAADSRVLVRQRGAVPFTGIAYAGAVDQRKGIDTLVHTLAKLRATPPVQLHVFGVLGFVGTVPAGEYIATALKGAQAYVNATVHGAINGNDLWPRLRDERLLLVMPSLLENQPMTVVNANIFGIPTLVYDVGGVAEMLEPKSRAQVLVAPQAEALLARLEAAMKSRSAYVPVLHPQLLKAERRWRQVVERAAAPTERRTGSAGAGHESAFTIVRLGNGDTVADVAARCGAPNAAAVVLLMPAGIAGVLPAEEAALRSLAGQLQRGAGTPTVAGATGLVLLGDTITFPDPPYFLLSHGFVTCAGAEAPLLVRGDAVTAFAGAQNADTPFQQWLFAAWLMYAGYDGKRRVIARLPRPLFRHSGLVDADRCFYSNQGAVPRPQALLANLSAALGAGPGVVGSHAAGVDYGTALRATCAEYLQASPNAAEWLANAGSPQPVLCNASVEHGLFSLRTLKTVLLKSCGAYCAFPVGDMLPPPTPSLGWGLDTVQGCWQEVSSLHPCAQWYAGRPHILPGVLPPLPLPPPLATDCGTGAWCERATIVAHVDGCLRGGSGTFDGVSEAVTASIAPGKPVNPGLLLRSGGVSAAQTRKRFPAARIVLLVCNPFQRLSTALEAWQSGGSDVAALRFHNVTTLDDAVDAASAESGRCVGSDSLGRRGGALRHCEELLRRLVYPGMYALTAYDWIAQFGTGNVTVLDVGADSEQVEAEVGAEAWATLSPLLGPPVPLPAALQPGLRSKMRSLYGPQIEWLASLTGSDYNWTRGLQ